MLPRSAVSSEAKSAAAEFLPDDRTEDSRELAFEIGDTARGLHQQHRVDHPVAAIGIDVEPQLIGREHLLRFHVEVHHPPVDQFDPLVDRDAEDDPRAG